MNPTLLLGYAQQLLTGDEARSSGQSARLAALIARQALETGITERCAAIGAASDRATMRSRLAILRGLDDPSTERLASLWYQLSNLCHQHAYEMAPTVAEVDALCEGVASVLIAAPATQAHPDAGHDEGSASPE